MTDLGDVGNQEDVRKDEESTQSDLWSYGRTGRSALAAPSKTTGKRSWLSRYKEKCKANYFNDVSYAVDKF